MKMEKERGEGEGEETQRLIGTDVVVVCTLYKYMTEKGKRKYRECGTAGM
jgi:hypothetical protein